MTPSESANSAAVAAYLAALEQFVQGDALARFFTPTAVQVELPNRLNPQGGTSDLATLLRRAEQARSLLNSQDYAVRSVLAHGDQVAVEAEWSGELAVSAGALVAGTRMKAYFAMFFVFENGLIASQRNYDCFEPW
ncbi:MAG: hypothetical protein JWP29_1827 [Rhodoferax sp.]|nr:hypothetical protein [Rhodoferax sp.]